MQTTGQNSIGRSVNFHRLTCGNVFTAALFLAVFLTAGKGTAGEPEAAEKTVVQRGPFASLELHGSILTNVADWSFFSGSFGYALKGGYRFKHIGIFAQFEHNLWLATEYEREVLYGALNIGVGAEIIYADGFVRTSLAIGPSILASDTYLDEAGSVGFFVDFRPVGLRWAVHKYLIIGLDPIHFTFVAPVLDGIPLMYTQYRTTLYLEAVF